jgi:hypothetical protein
VKNRRRFKKPPFRFSLAARTHQRGQIRKKARPFEAAVSNRRRFEQQELVKNQDPVEMVVFAIHQPTEYTFPCWRRQTG